MVGLRHFFRHRFKGRSVIENEEDELDSCIKKKKIVKKSVIPPKKKQSALIDWDDDDDQ